MDYDGFLPKFHLLEEKGYSCRLELDLKSTIEKKTIKGEERNIFDGIKLNEMKDSQGTLRTPPGIIQNKLYLKGTSGLYRLDRLRNFLHELFC